MISSLACSYVCDLHGHSRGSAHRAGPAIARFGDDTGQLRFRAGELGADL